MSNQTISYLLNCPTLLPSHSLSAENLFFTSQKCRHTQIKTPSKSWTPSTKTWCIITNFFIILWQQMPHSGWGVSYNSSTCSLDPMSATSGIAFQLLKFIPLSLILSLFSTCIFEKSSHFSHLFLHFTSSPVLFPSITWHYQTPCKRHLKSLCLLSFPIYYSSIAIWISSFTHPLHKLSERLFLNFCSYTQW